MATIMELENRVKRLEERSSIQDETIKRMFDFVQRVINDQDRKVDERFSVQEETAKRILDFVQRFVDDQFEKRGVYAEHLGEGDEQPIEYSENQKEIEGRMRKLGYTIPK